MKLLALFAVAAAPLLATAAPFHKRQATTTAIIIPTATETAPPPPPPATTTAPGGSDDSEPTPTVAPFPPNVAQLSAWQALEANPDLTNFTALVRTYSPGLVANLNNTTPAPPPPPPSEPSPSPSSTVSAQQQDVTTTIVTPVPTGTAAPPGPTPPPPAATEWTVFAPTNAAMQPLLNSSFFRFVEALAATRLSSGGQPANDTLFTPVLQRFLDYHIVRGVVLTRDFPPAGQNVTLLTVAGLNVTAQRAPTRPQPQPRVPPVQLGSPTPSATLQPAQDDGNGDGDGGDAPPQETFWVSDAQILVADVRVRNGVIHVVDRPLSPLGAGEAAPPVAVPTSIAVTSLPTVTLPTTVPSVTATVPIPTGIATLVPPTP